MGYKLGIDTADGTPHPAYQYENLEDAQNAVEKSLVDGYIFMSGGITIFTGGGTAYKVISDARFNKEDDEPLRGCSHALVVQIGRAQLPPFGFNTEDAMRAAVDEARESGVFRHTGEPEQEYTWVHTTVGTVFMEMTSENFMERQRRLLAEQMRKAQEAQREPLVAVPKIILPRN